MDKQPHKLTRKMLKPQGTPKTKKSLIIGTIVATIIAATPFIFNLYQIVPDSKVWDNFLFTYDSLYYEDVNVVAWTLMGKIIPIILLFIWFFTNKHWWYHVIIVPIAMYFYQIITTLDGDLQFADTNQIIYLLPVMAIIIPSIYLIRAQMFDKINTADKTMEELEEEFKIKPKGFFSKITDYF